MKKKQVDEEELMSYAECLEIAFNAIAAMDLIDGGLLTGSDAYIKEEVILKSIRIIHKTISEVYEEFFPEETNP